MGYEMKGKNNVKNNAKIEAKKPHGAIHRNKLMSITMRRLTNNVTSRYIFFFTPEIMRTKSTKIMSTGIINRGNSGMK